MSDLSIFHKTASDAPSDNGFTLDDRTVEDLLKLLKDYSQQIPFDKDKNWDAVFLSPVNAERLAAIYRQPGLADGSLAPHQALLLAFYRLLETPKALLNRLPGMHRQLYYRGLLGLKERGMVPDQVALACQLEKGTRELLLPAGTLMDAGQDSQGNPVQYALDNAMLGNQGRWSDLRWCQPANSDSSPRTSRVLFDQQNKVLWPENGVRLFTHSGGEEQSVVTGRVVGSELLAMSGGDRTITVTLQTAVTDDDIKAITAGISGTGQWLALDISKGDGTSLTLKLSAAKGAITPPGGLDGFTSAMPLLKLSRTDGKPVPEVTALKVDVSGLTQVMYSTDDGVEKLSVTSYPFGHSPVLGSGFNLVAADWCNKPQELTITLTPEWLDLPANSFSEWYEGYGVDHIDNNAFKVTSPFITGEKHSTVLFSGNSEEPPVAVPITLTVEDLSCSLSKSVDPQDWQNWLHLELSGHDFLHQKYWELLPTKPDLNPPYTPKVRSLAISYSGADTEVKEQYLLSPFGYGLESQVSATVADDVNPQLYLGFSDIEPGQELSLHWQLQSPQALNMRWQYLDQGNSWQSLDATVKDNTGGLFTSGLWSASLPADAAQGAQMPAGRYWIRAVVTPPAQAPGADASICAYPRLKGLRTNAVTATLINGESLSNSHFIQPLPAGTVRRPVQRLNGLAQVEQPWPSQGGRAPESEAEFLPRVARQLTHRGRAQTWSDMVALLSERYPEIGYVHIPLSEQLSSLPARCTQQLIVIPANGEQDNNDALRPKFAPARLTAMQDYLKELSSPWVDISVVNPDYRDVPVTYVVEFTPGTNQAYALCLLRQALERKYMPWGGDGQSSAIAGAELDYYAMVAFIQQLPMVERVDRLTLDGQSASVVSTDTQVLILTLPGASHQ
ncbi:hypothetical protein KVG95_21295 [Pseudomonas sp. SWRI79]|uniref:Baseplate protein J-like domain-containing protein n=1 Tax=Pseudomonas farris TaxID=2841207 RepID=A0ABS6PZG7_9PSED|nr:hypothetical protein [Pseudomonas farris]MBV4465867.1 hypothetical protein [Pseudomonas farris]